jgi:hypothetical protein
MESDSKKDGEIILVLNKIILLLGNNNEPAWEQQIKKLLLDFKASKEKAEVILLIRAMLSSGAGSLSDLVLYRDGKVLVEENNALYVLVNEAYGHCINSK